MKAKTETTFLQPRNNFLRTKMFQPCMPTNYALLRSRLISPSVHQSISPSVHQRQFFLLFLLITFFSTLIFGQKPKNDNKFEIPNNSNSPEKKIYKQNTVVRENDGVTITLYGVSEEGEGNTPEDKVLNFLEKKATLFGLPKNFKQDLTYHATSKGPAGTVVRYRQNYKKIPVEGSEITVTLDNNGTIVSVLNGYKLINKDISIIPKKNVAFATDKLNKHFGIKTKHKFFKNDLFIVFQKNLPILAHKINLICEEAIGDWQGFINDETGDIIEVKDIASYQSGNIFNPDPLSYAKATYGSGGYIDNNDENSSDLQARLLNVSLSGMKFANGLYQLEGNYAKITDDEAPYKGLFSQPSSYFNFNRKDDGFEAVMCYYFIEKSMNYLNTLGITVTPYQSASGGKIKFDPHGLNGSDNSYYVKSTGALIFGEGGVDDAEDADVVIHELGHGIHDWITNGGLSNADGLSEGTGDYWAQSYSRSLLNQWPSTNPAYHWVFNWDGHNPFWAGRATNDTRFYTQTVAAGIHDRGQIWATAMMRIFDGIGRTKSDKVLWEGLRMTNSLSTQEEAAAKVYQAALNMNYSWNELCIIYNSFVIADYTPFVTHTIPFTPPHSGTVSFGSTTKNMGTATSVSSTSFIVNLSNVSSCTWSVYSGTAYYFTPNSTGTSVNIQIPTNGNVTFALKTTTSCGSSTSYRTFTHSSSSWRNSNGSVYPNPFTNSLSIELYKEDGNITNDYLNVENRGNSYDNEFFNDANILIYDQNAKIIRRFSYKNTSNTINLNLSDLQYGIYFIEIQQGLYIRREKIIKGQ
jgi:Zn-dependent metalloprotease